MAIRDAFGYICDMLSPETPFVPAVAVLPAVPAYGLFGESVAPETSIHIEALCVRAPSNGWHIPMHRHPTLMQFVLISSGALEVYLDGSTRRLAAPALVSIPADRTHGFAFRPATEGYVLSVRDHPVATGLSGRALAIDIPARPVAAPCDPDAVRAAARLHALRGHSGGGARAMRHALLAELAAHAQLLLEASGVPGEHRPGHRLSRRFESQIEQRLAERWTVAAHARALAVSTGHLNRSVRASFGTTASALIARATLRRAQTLLLHTDGSVAQIAFSLGFDDPPHFSRRFRTLSGQSPSAWRRTATGG